MYIRTTKCICTYSAAAAAATAAATTVPTYFFRRAIAKRDFHGRARQRRSALKKNTWNINDIKEQLLGRCGARGGSVLRCEIILRVWSSSWSCYSQAQLAVQQKGAAQHPSGATRHVLNACGVRMLKARGGEHMFSLSRANTHARTYVQYAWGVEGLGRGLERMQVLGGECRERRRTSTVLVTTSHLPTYVRTSTLSVAESPTSRTSKKPLTRTTHTQYPADFSTPFHSGSLPTRCYEPKMQL